MSEAILLFPDVSLAWYLVTNFQIGTEWKYSNINLISKYVFITPFYKIKYVSLRIYIVIYVHVCNRPSSNLQQPQDIWRNAILLL